MLSPVYFGFNSACIKFIIYCLNKLFVEYQNGNDKAKDELVNANLKLVLSILRRFHTTHDNINDISLLSSWIHIYQS